MYICIYVYIYIYIYKCTELYRINNVPRVIKSLIRHFCTRPVAHSMQLWAGPDHKGPGV